MCGGVWRWCSGVWRCVVVCGGGVVGCGGVWRCCSGVWRWCSGVWRRVEGCGGGVVVCGGLWRWCTGVWRWCSGVWRCVVGCGGVWRCVVVLMQDSIGQAVVVQSLFSIYSMQDSGVCVCVCTCVCVCVCVYMRCPLRSAQHESRCCQETGGGEQLALIMRFQTHSRLWAETFTLERFFVCVSKSHPFQWL